MKSVCLTSDTHSMQKLNLVIRIQVYQTGSGSDNDPNPTRITGSVTLRTAGFGPAKKMSHSRKILGKSLNVYRLGKLSKRRNVEQKKNLPSNQGCGSSSGSCLRATGSRADLLKTGYRSDLRKNFRPSKNDKFTLFSFYI